MMKISSFSEEIKRSNNVLQETGMNFLLRRVHLSNASVSSIFYYHELLRRSTITPNSVSRYIQMHTPAGEKT